MSKYDNVNDYPHGFGLQEDSYSCGAYAFAHAMNLIGIPLVIDESKKLCRTVSYWKSFKKNLTVEKILSDIVKAFANFLYDPGTEPSGILKACKKLGLTVSELETDSKSEAKEFLRNNIVVKGYPVILHVNYGDGDEEDLGHWVTCGNIINGKEYVIIDSAPFDEDDVITIYSWGELVERFTWDESFSFYGIAVGNKGVSAVRRFGKIGRELEGRWGHCLADLVEIFDLNNHKNNNTQSFISAKEFFLTYGDDIIENTSYWLLEAKRKKIKRMLKNYRAVSEAYNIKIPKNKVSEVLISFVTAFNATMVYDSNN